MRTSAPAALGGTGYRYFPLDTASRTVPVTVRVLLEGVVRTSGEAEQDAAEALAEYPRASATIPFRPSRILLQDYTGIPAAVDLAAMRAAMQRAGRDPARIEPLIPVDLIIDHSVQADFFGARDVYERNIERDYSRNRERYAVLRWAQQAFKTFRVVPPGAGICHQVNLERLAQVVVVRDGVAMPDTLFGADSHTTMVNGLGVFGWGVGGIEAEAAMLGQPTYLPWPVVVGVKLTGKLPTGTTATDLVLTLTELFRRKGVVNKFLEFTGDALSTLAVPERATVSNMCPEYGATAALFPVDRQTLRYLEQTGRPRDLIDLVERYTKAQGMFRTDGDPTPTFDEMIEVDLASVKPSVAGPKRPQDRVNLPMVWDSFVGPKPTKGVSLPGHTEGPKPVNDAPQTMVAAATPVTAAVAERPRTLQVSDGSVVIAAITSCTNTSNPSVMLAAGLLAKKAVEKGLSVRPYVKTTLAPGSRVVTRYLEAAGLTPYLEQLGFYFVGVGCFTCLAEGTPVLQANGMARRIEDLSDGDPAHVFAAAPEGGTAIARRTALIRQGVREVVTLTLQDGRTLTSTPDHEILRSDGRWVRADRLRPGRDRVVMGLEGPIDVPGEDERGYELRVGSYDFRMDTSAARQRTLAFARLLGHLLDDGSISALGQGLINVGQAVDREAVLNDIELITGKRPAGTRYDERKWSIAVPMDLTAGIATLPGVRVGRRMKQPAALPAFVLDGHCPVAVVREFLGGAFGADGIAPGLHRYGPGEEHATLEQPGYSHAVKPEHVAAQRQVIRQLLQLLARCSVRTQGAIVREYAVRHAETSYTAGDGEPRTEVRLELPDGLSFITKVGFRYCVDKQLRASAAAVYWRTLDSIHRQRLWMSDRIRQLHRERPGLSFRATRDLAARELEEREAVVFEHCSTFKGATKYEDLSEPTDRTFRPLHRKTCGFPSPVALFKEMGTRDWFARLQARESADFSKRYCVDKESLTLPSFSLQVIECRKDGEREVLDLSVDELHSFVANGIVAHNCIGNAGPLATPEIEQEVKEHDLNVASVLSGNRNFEGRIHPLVKSSYLASPPLVVAYALAGTVHIDLEDEPIGNGRDGKPVFLRDIWPTLEEVNDVAGKAIKQEFFTEEYGKIFEGDRFWKTMPSPKGVLYEWDKTSTYVQEPPFFQDFAPNPPASVPDVVDARALAVLGDSVTTDHISPAGAIPSASPAGQYLIAKGVKPADFNQYGTRRGNHEVLIRGTFANLRLRNLLVEREGWWTRHFPSGEEMTIYDATVRYQQEGVPLVVLAGKEYGSGSSRDWAAKGPNLMGVRAAIAESFERIHRSNLVMMGVLPLEYSAGESAKTLGLTGQEAFTIRGLDKLAPRAKVQVEAIARDGKRTSFMCTARVDDPVDVDYMRHGGILQKVLRERIAAT